MSLSTAKIISAGNSDRGRTRKNNEDSFLLDDDIGLYAVADGIGGHSGGEVASGMAVDTLREIVTAHLQRNASELSSLSEGGNDNVVAVIENAFRIANSRLIETGRKNPDLSGMGTTLTAVYLEGSDAHIAHIGDSRAYLLRNGELEQVTDDHGVVAEQVRAGLIRPDQARKSPYRHIITRALGIEQQIQSDHRTIAVRDDDVLLLCSDGLTEMVEDQEIERVLLRNDPASGVAKLIAAANDHGGVDNITVVIVKIGGLRYTPDQE